MSLSSLVSLPTEEDKNSFRNSIYINCGLLLIHFTAAYKVISIAQEIIKGFGDSVHTRCVICHTVNV